MSFFENLREKYKNYLLNRYLNKVKAQSKDVVYSNSNSKTVISNGVTMKLSAKSENLKNLVKDSAKIEITKYLNQPEKLIEAIEKDGVRVIRTKYSDVILSKIDEEEGFIVGQEGLYALKLNFLLFSFGLQPFSLSLKTKPMFILSEKPFDIFAFAEYFYKYVALKRKMPGLDFRTQKKFSRINKYAPDSDSVYENMPINDLLALKEAVQRSVEGVNFATEFIREHKTSKKAFENMKNEDGTSI